MYEVQFIASSSADWMEAVELIDSTTNQALVVPDDAVFNLAIGDRCWSGDFKASSDDGKITRPLPNVIAWSFTPADMSRFWPRNSYKVGLTMVTGGLTIQILVGTLAVIDGVV